MSKGNLFLGFGRGKVGVVVFSRLNGEQVTRARNRSPRKPKYPLQLLQLGQAHGAEVAIGLGLQVGVIVPGHDEDDLVDADEDLLAGLLHGNALGLLGLGVQQNMLTYPVVGVASKN